MPAAHRLRRPAQFRAVLRGRGAGRSGGDLLVVHAAHVSRPADGSVVPRVGFVVSKAVGNAVVRTRTKRVLRHVVAAELGAVPADVDLVVRANPPLAGAPTPRVREDLRRQLHQALSRLR
nr:ribonuclease P protein component [Allobranchiibius sp. GilTou38]